jgi:hypothetical protein
MTKGPLTPAAAYLRLPLPLRATNLHQPRTAAAAHVSATLEDSTHKVDDLDNIPHQLDSPKLRASPSTLPYQSIAARTLSSTASNIVSEFLIGKNKMAMIYFMPNPYFKSFEEVMEITRFDFNKHRTAGLCLTTAGNRFFLGSISPSTPAAKIPRGHTRIKKAWLIWVGLTIVTTIKEAQVNGKLPPAHALSPSYSHTLRYNRTSAMMASLSCHPHLSTNTFMTR